MAKKVKLPGRVESAEVGGIVAGAGEILDDEKGKVQSVINSEVDAELVRLENEKQDNITVDGVPTEGSGNPVSSGAVYTADKALSDAIEAILLLIPSAASSLNQLADKTFVRDSIDTSTATFRGTFNVVSDLHLSASATHAQIEAALNALSLGADTNDYCFVQVPDSDSTENIKVTERYKFNGTGWAYEYDLNNSGFTSDQWAAINSNITALLVTKLSQLPTADALAALLAGKQDNLTFDDEPTSGSNNPVKSGGIYARNNEIVALINALDAAKQDKLTFDSTPINGSSNPVTSGGVYEAIYLVQVTLAGLDGRLVNAESAITVLTENVGILRTLYQALNQSDIIVGALPSTGVANTVYRVPGTSSYADWMYDGAWVKLAEYTTLDGYLYKGIAVPTGSPAASADKMFYFALTAGKYTNFGGLTVTEGITVLKYDGANWTKEQLSYSDGIFDVTAYSGRSFASLDALLSDEDINNLIPAAVRKPGMSIKFEDSSDNKYVQYRLMADTFNTTPANWQGVDDEPTAGSDNLVKSGGLYPLYSNAMRVLEDNNGFGIIGLATSFDFDSAKLISYVNRDMSLQPSKSSQQVDIEFIVGGSSKKYYYFANGEAQRSGYELIEMQPRSVSQNVGEVYVQVNWQGFVNTELNIPIIKTNVKRLLNDYATKLNAIKQVDKIVFDGAESLGIKSIAVDFDFSSAAIKRYINRYSESTYSQYIIIDFVVNSTTVQFLYRTDVGTATATGLQTVTLTNGDRNVSVVVDWQNVEYSSIDYPINKQSVIISSVLRKEINAVYGEIDSIREDSVYDVAVDSSEWQVGKITPNSGTGGSSKVNIQVGSTTYSCYALRTKITQSTPIHPIAGTIPLETKRIVAIDDDVYFFLATYQSDNTYLGVYDVNTDTFDNSTSTANYVYKTLDFGKILKKYSTYQFAICVCNIAAESALDVNDIVDYIKYQNYIDDYVKETKAESELPCNYVGREIEVFTKGLFIGDSLTSGTFNHNEGGTMQYEVIPEHSYPAVLGRNIGCEVTNKGDGGQTCTTWWQRHQDDTDYDGHDFCIIQLGVNDVGKQTGGWNSDSTTNLINIINKVKAENNKIKVFVATIIPSSYYKGINSTTGGSYDDASQAIRDAVASLADPNVILVDIARYGHTGATYYSNGHLNALGYQRLAQDYISYLSWIIKETPTQFTQTAFIGTNMSYN